MTNTILFDLDGTLLDTASDMGNALNELRHTHKLPPLPLSVIRPYAGYGSREMLKLAFNIDDDHPHYADYLDGFLQNYQLHLTKTTQLFPGMDELLTQLDEKGIIWGIVTNKPSRFTYDLLKAMNLNQRAACIICGDSLSKRKPDPDQILHACDLLKCSPAETIYLGDTIIDVIASKAAGTKSIVALYGYIKAEEDPLSWNADGYIKHPADIMDWLF